MNEKQFLAEIAENEKTVLKNQRELQSKISTLSKSREKQQKRLADLESDLIKRQAAMDVIVSEGETPPLALESEILELESTIRLTKRNISTLTGKITEIGAALSKIPAQLKNIDQQRRGISTLPWFRKLDDIHQQEAEIFNNILMLVGSDITCEMMSKIAFLAAHRCEGHGPIGPVYSLRNIPKIYIEGETAPVGKHADSPENFWFKLPDESTYQIRPRQAGDRGNIFSSSVTR